LGFFTKRPSGEADGVNLFGTSQPTGKSFTGDPNRFSYGEVKEREATIVERLANSGHKLSESDRPEYLNYMVVNLLALSSGELSGRNVYALYQSANLLTSGYYLEQTHFSPEIDEELRSFSDIVANLADAVAFLEGNIPPNDLGYIGDQCVSLVRKDEIVREYLDRAYQVILSDAEKVSKVFDSDIKRVYNDVVDRLQYQRPLFMGRPVSDRQIQKFE
jgi:hypothetical protein